MSHRRRRRRPRRRPRPPCPRDGLRRWTPRRGKRTTCTWRAAPRHGSSPRTRERYACEPHAHRRRAGIGARKSVARVADCPSCHVAESVPRAGIEQPRVSWADRRRLLMPRALEVSRTRAYRVHQFTSFTNHDIRLAALVTGEPALTRVCRSVTVPRICQRRRNFSARIAQAVIIYSLSLTLTLSVTNAVSSILNIALRSFPRGPCQLPNSVPGATPPARRSGFPQSCWLLHQHGQRHGQPESNTLDHSRWIAALDDPICAPMFKNNLNHPCEDPRPHGFAPIRVCSQQVRHRPISTTPTESAWRPPTGHSFGGDRHSTLWRWVAHPAPVALGILDAIRAAAAAAAAHRLPRASISRWLA